VAYGPGQAYLPYPGMNPAWLAGNADRERTIGVLRAGFTEGRLTQDELGDRIARAYAARTYGELWTLTADLPAGPLPYPAGVAAVPWESGSPAVPPGAEPAASWQSAAALVITALIIFTLAALVTAIATAHAQPLPLPLQQTQLQQAPGVQQAQVQPFQQAKLAPFITGVGGRA
jgi:hypothetical protein